jgi:predicted ATPase
VKCKGENDGRKIAVRLSQLKGKVDCGIINQMSESISYSLRQMHKNYGENMRGFSHCEPDLKILQIRIGERGVFLSDDPEAALSPLKQLSLIFFIMEVLKKGKTQFISYTHPPVLMGIPGALIYGIQEDV